MHSDPRDLRHAAHGKPLPLLDSDSGPDPPPLEGDPSRVGATVEVDWLGQVQPHLPGGTRRPEFQGGGGGGERIREGGRSREEEG
eukprot:8509680-Pyramimonas_sp.AAC.1